MRRSSSSPVGRTSPVPTSPASSRSTHGTHAGARSASGPGSSAVSETVAALARGARVTTTAQRQPR